MAHRIRETWDDAVDRFVGPVGVDEAYVGGRGRNKHFDKRLFPGGGCRGKTALVGLRDRATGRIRAEVLDRTDKPTLQQFATDYTKPSTMVYTDDAVAYVGVRRQHASVCHSALEDVRGHVLTNGIESFWAMLKCGYQGTYHVISPRHPERYVIEFEARHNGRGFDTADQMCRMARAVVGKRLQYKTLIAGT